MRIGEWLKVGVEVARSVAASVVSGAPAMGRLAVGDAAPDFALAGSDGKIHTLAEHRGQRAVVVAWFPKAFTGG
ncbi:MAG: redoxin domain-containing protein [Acidobacteriota bacterium]